MSSFIGFCAGVTNTALWSGVYVPTCSTPFVFFDFSSFLSDSLDLEALSTAFGGCLLMFSIGAGIGSIINLIRKARV